MKLKIKRFFSYNKCIIISVALMFLLSFAFSHIVAVSKASYKGIIIVLNAGHGEVDGS